MKLICQNKKASFDYFLLDTYEAGIKLTGTDIKSIRAGKVNINDAYVVVRNGKVFIVNMFVAKYDLGNIFNHEERRSRELLLHRSQINKVSGKLQTEGIALVPTKMYFVDALVKVEFAIAKGKKLYDKREDLKRKDLAREAQKGFKDRY